MSRLIKVFHVSVGFLFLFLFLKIKISPSSFLLSPTPGREDGDITWLKDGEPIEDEEKVTRLDEKSSKLEIKKATFQDAGSYSCECDCESKTLYSATMQIHIHGM